jgi:hypothetical protein
VSSEERGCTAGFSGLGRLAEGELVGESAQRLLSVATGSVLDETGSVFWEPFLAIPMKEPAALAS